MSQKSKFDIDQFLNNPLPNQNRDKNNFPNNIEKKFFSFFVILFFWLLGTVGVSNMIMRFFGNDLPAPFPAIISLFLVLSSFLFLIKFWNSLKGKSRFNWWVNVFGCIVLIIFFLVIISNGPSGSNAFDILFSI
tara:strand:- start:29 stop:430 length:402 start_codon:yes stop_codon:yes gene_type:complete